LNHKLAVLNHNVAGKRGELLTYQPTRHHGHAVIRFLPTPEEAAEPKAVPAYAFSDQVNEFYRHPSPSSYNLNKLLYDLRHDAVLRRRLIGNPAEVSTERNLSAREAAVIDSLLDEDIDLLRGGKTHPVVDAAAHPLGMLMSLVVVQADMRRMRRKEKQ
jgi:hypothetical protein